MNSPDRPGELRMYQNRGGFGLTPRYVAKSGPSAIAFNIHRGLFRALLTMFALLAVFALAGVVWALCLRPARLVPFVLWTGLFAVATLIAYMRCRKRSEDFGQSIFDPFLVGAARS